LLLTGRAGTGAGYAFSQGDIGLAAGAWSATDFGAAFKQFGSALALKPIRKKGIHFFIFKNRRFLNKKSDLSILDRYLIWMRAKYEIPDR